MEGDTYTCGKCPVRHVVGYPARADAERFRCPDCGLAFWCVMRDRYRIRVGVRPNEIERINMEAQAKEEERESRLSALIKSAYPGNALEE